jgi:hypothetical protein
LPYAAENSALVPCTRRSAASRGCLSATAHQLRRTTPQEQNGASVRCLGGPSAPERDQSRLDLVLEAERARRLVERRGTIGEQLLRFRGSAGFDRIAAVKAARKREQKPAVGADARRRERRRRGRDARKRRLLDGVTQPVGQPVAGRGGDQLLGAARDQRIALGVSAGGEGFVCAPAECPCVQPTEERMRPFPARRTAKKPMRSRVAKLQTSQLAAGAEKRTQRFAARA